MILPFDPAATYSGKYQVTDATASDGRKYNGEVVIEPHGLFGHVTAKLTGIGERFGLAAVFRNRLLIAWGPKDKVEIGAYHIGGQKMHGIWVPPGAKGDDLSACGQEFSNKKDAKSWEIEKAYAIDQQPYTGHLVIEASSPATPDQYQPVQIAWKLHDGDYAAFGLRLEDFMVTTFSFEPEKPYGISAYTVTPEGFEGVQFWKDATTLAREQWRR